MAKPGREEKWEGGRKEGSTERLPKEKEGWEESSSDHW
jgi:hypothetical protein